MDQISSPSSLLAAVISHHLQLKYDTKFNFFMMKDINHIIYNATRTSTTQRYKDMVEFIEDTDYFKRYYRRENATGHNEITDRMKLLRNYYRTSDLLKYQYPMMTINNMQEMFLKRHRRINRVGEESEEEEEEEVEKSQETSQIKVVFDESFMKREEYLTQMSWSAIITGQFEGDSSSFEAIPTAKSAIEFQEEEHCLFDDEKELKRKEFFIRIGVLNEEINEPFKLNDENDLHGERDLSHLIVNFDDMDRQHVIRQYQKLTNKENQGIKPEDNTFGWKGGKITSFAQMKMRKPLSSSLCLSGDESVVLTPLSRTSVNLNKQSMLLGSRLEREQEQKVMKKSTVLESKPRNFIFDDDSVISQLDGEQSPIDRDLHNTNYDFFTPTSHKDCSRGEFKVNMERKGPKPLKQSQILSRDHLRYDKKDRNQFDLRELKKEMQELKEKQYSLFNSTKIDKMPTEPTFELKKHESHHTTVQKEANQVTVQKFHLLQSRQNQAKRSLTRVKSLQKMSKIELESSYLKEQ